MTYSYGDSCCNPRSVVSGLLPYRGSNETVWEVWAHQNCRTGWIRLSVHDTEAAADLDCLNYRHREWSGHYDRVEVV